MKKAFPEKNFTSAGCNVQNIYNSCINSLPEKLSRNKYHNSSDKHQQNLFNFEKLGRMLIKGWCLGGEELISNKRN